MKEMMPETLRMLAEDYEGHNDKLNFDLMRSHASAWDKDMDGWGRALNDIVHLKARIEALEKALRECLNHLDVENMTMQGVERRARAALAAEEKP